MNIIDRFKAESLRTKHGARRRPRCLQTELDSGLMLTEKVAFLAILHSKYNPFNCLIIARLLRDFTPTIS